MTQPHVIGNNPSSALDPSYPLRAMFDGVYFYSVESFLLSLQISNKNHQAHCCSLNPNDAYLMVTNMRDKADGLGDLYHFFWHGEQYTRDDQRFDILLDRFFIALLESPAFIVELRRTLGSHLRVNPKSLSRVSNVLNCDEFQRRAQAVRDTTLRTLKNASINVFGQVRPIKELASIEDAPL